MRFGVEVEFHTNADAVIAGLYARNMAGMAELHRYHCDCDHCHFESEYVWRGQTDSSCSGEIISKPFRGMTDTAREAFADICGIAVDVDAEPGMTAGLHVHVAVSALERSDLVSAYQQAAVTYLMWEHALTEEIATGRWNTMRANNYRVAPSISEYVYGGYSFDPLIFHERMVDTLTNDRGDVTVRDIWSRMSRQDRHSTLNTRTNHPTWEFRLWNSTRTAWRMELAAGVSSAFLDPAVIPHLKQAAIDDIPSGALLADVLAARGRYENTAQLVRRQLTYLTEVAPTAPSILTS